MSDSGRVLPLPIWFGTALRRFAPQSPWSVVVAQDTVWRLNEIAPWAGRRASRWMEGKMPVVNVRDVRKRLSQLLDAVSSGEVIVIVRRGRPAARLVPVEQAMTPFPDRSSLRDALPPMRTSVGATVREMREGERY